MPGWPVRRSARLALLARAEHRFGAGATELQYILHWLRCGFTVSDLADALSADINHSFRRSTLSGMLRRLAPDAKQQIAATRTAARHANRAIVTAAAKEKAAAERPPLPAPTAGLRLADLQAAPPAPSPSVETYA
jgi:hypothetical protein